MTYSVPDPANEASDPVAPDPAAPTPSAVVGPDGSGIEQAATDDPPLPRHAAPESLDAPTPAVGNLEGAADEPLRVAHEDSEDYEKFVADPEAAEEVTRARMDAQAEAEKAAAGITPAADHS